MHTNREVFLRVNKMSQKSKISALQVDFSMRHFSMTWLASIGKVHSKIS